ncbi:hypothetical protein PybrP1_009008 [[Pythium] brassicae (nom. inval.)]|nr:hypothetical protein PybrP1_009008 [[Pythium] brassicae (nom. inval.)]
MWRLLHGVDDGAHKRSCRSMAERVAAAAAAMAARGSGGRRRHVRAPDGGGASARPTWSRRAHRPLQHCGPWCVGIPTGAAA